MIFWLYNRRRFHKLKHQIPAGIVKSYLDSVIQNSTALKSALLRGGGMDIAESQHEKVPSVISMTDLTSMTFDHKENGQRKDVPEEIQQKSAEIASLKNKLGDRDKIIGDLENQLKGKTDTVGTGVNQQEFKLLKKQNKSLEDKLNSLKSSIGQEKSAGTQDQSQINSVLEERDELKERLAEYSIIEEDLANLKRLQQENEQLRKTIEDSRKEIPELETEQEESKEETAKEEPKEETAKEEPKQEKTKEETTSQEASKKLQQQQGDEKTAEELLSEFEKMLG